MTTFQISTECKSAVGVKRGDFSDGQATVLVLDHFQNLWERYSNRVPRECNLLFVRDTTSAEKALRENPAIGVVIVQGLSRKVNDRVVDAFAKTAQSESDLLAWIQDRLRAGEPVHDWLDSPHNTLAFLKTLQQQGFGGLVQVVSRTLQNYQRSEMLGLEGLRVQFMDKQHFFQSMFTGKVNQLRERIAQFEQYEQKTGRKLGPSSSMGRLFERLQKQVVYPHPAEDRLFNHWERELTALRNNRAMAVEMALTWLEELKQRIGSGDVRAIYDHASQLPQQRQMCDCLSDDDFVGEYRWMIDFHFLHDEFNRAVWEILDMAGLTEWMRLELELDLAAQNLEDPDFGRHVHREYGEQLREFFGPEPSQQWVGWDPGCF